MGPGETVLVFFLQEIERRKTTLMIALKICYLPEMCLMLCITLPACFTYSRGDSVNKRDNSDDCEEGGLCYEASKGVLSFNL